jgi:hypothetical protein
MYFIRTFSTLDFGSSGILLNYAALSHSQKTSLHYAVFLGRVTKLRKATGSFVMSVRPFVPIQQQLGPHLMDFYEIEYFEICRKNSNSLNSDKNNGYFISRHAYL